MNMNTQEMIESIESPTMRRILESGRRPITCRLSRCQLDKLKQWFDRNREHNAYLFYDGHVEAESTCVERLNSRPAQLVSIATEGFVILVSRWAVEFAIAVLEEN